METSHRSCVVTGRVIAGWVLLALTSTASAGEDLPDGFSMSVFAAGFTEPIAIAPAPAPDGRLFVAQRGGTIYIVENGTVLSPPFATLDVFTGGESGLLGLALDPDFLSNGHVYAFVTATEQEQQILRLTNVNGQAEAVTVIRNQLPTQGQIHNGGCLRVGPDGKLYFSIGDTGQPELSQSLTSLAGKVCRINLDGSTPTGNPFTTPTGTPRAVYALGFRNPFRFCFAPDGRLFVGDVGSSGDPRREEINLVRAGENYGWPEVEGFDETGVFPEFADPLLAYVDEGSSIAGCVYYDATQFPEPYRDNLFHLDFVSHGLFRVALDGDTVVSHELFYQAQSGPVDLALGPDGSLYYAEMCSGNVMRITYQAGDEAGNATDGEGGGEAPAEVTEPSPEPPARNLCGAGLGNALASALVLTLGMLFSRGRRS